MQGQNILSKSPLSMKMGQSFLLLKNVIETMDCEITVSTVMGIAYCKSIF